MTIQTKYFKYCKKWAIYYQGRPRAVGNTKAQAIDEFFSLLKAKIIKQNI